ncbi:OmpA family protein [Litoreibacter janthinus]|uniref:OmpA family protein n=1 Tax=Litoreibacter janthinus TaxID=670154 RepID=A0A1I6IEH7_9RHOB|nr:OmpA family protein [Litoreibacter janthinus]SFR65044.1 OmpA family protein [Litoreibacter janthinus]
MKRLLTTAAVLAALSAPASADTEYTTEELVDFFVNSIDMGATRGICIGTAQECDTSATPVAPQGLDMRINFELDSAELTQEAQESLKVFALMMQDERLEIARFVVEGHTDARGSEGYNLDLSDARAASVSKFLTDQGISDERLSAIGLGKTQPRVADEFDPENRRVELRIDLR